MHTQTVSLRFLIIKIENAPSDYELMLIASQCNITEDKIHLLNDLVEIVTDLKFEYGSEWKLRTVDSESYWA